MARDAGYVAAVKYVCSIYPGQLEPIWRNYGPTPQGEGRTAVRRSCWRLQPVPKAEMRKNPFVLTVPDCWESIRNYLGGRGEITPKFVPCEEIMADIMNQWVGGMFNVPDGAKPGVMEIANTFPTQAELAQLITAQSRYFEFWFSQAEQIHAGQRTAVEMHGGRITPLMLLAADWLGERRGWSHPEIVRDVKPCPWCQEMISAAAIICPNCTKMVQKPTKELMELDQQTAGV